MLAIQVGDQIYELADDNAEELISRLPGPPLEGGNPPSESLQDTLRNAFQSQEPAKLEHGELAVLGAVIEAWATELGVDAADVQKLRNAISDELP